MIQRNKGYIRPKNYYNFFNSLAHKNKKTRSMKIGIGIFLLTCKSTPPLTILV